jgi:pilus assembly protein Flp/PilA
MSMPPRSFLSKLTRDQQGATTVEYGLILVMLVITIISAVSGVADENTGLWAIVRSKSAEAHGTQD